MPSQEQIVEALLNPKTYPEDSGQVQLLQTHISYVFITRNFVYKVKKAVNFGFLDFSTLEKRRYFCQKELELNKRLCEDMYIEVTRINKNKDDFNINGKGETIEYALKMKRLPQERIMTRLIEENKVDKKLIDQIAKIIAQFHSIAETSMRIREIGSWQTVNTNWDENFEQTSSMVGKTISLTDFQTIQEKIISFLINNRLLFERRAAEGKIKDCHGDIHSGNIFVTDRIYIFDAIEFNERFRYSDVAADMAFLSMDLDFKGRKDLSDIFVRKYVEYSGDKELLKLLTFYKCYRAYVRGKVVSFRLNDHNISEIEKQNAANEAKAYFKLSKEYAEKL